MKPAVRNSFACVSSLCSVRNKSRIYIAGTNDNVFPSLVSNLIACGIDNLVAIDCIDSSPLKALRAEKITTIQMDQVTRNTQAFELLVDLSSLSEKTNVLRTFLQKGIPIISYASTSVDNSSYDLISFEKHEGDDFGFVSGYQAQNIMIVQPAEGSNPNPLNDILTSLVVQYLQHCSLYEDKIEALPSIQSILSGADINALSLCRTSDEYNNKEETCCDYSSIKNEIVEENYLSNESQQIHAAFQALYQAFPSHEADAFFSLVDAHCHIQLKDLGKRAEDALLLANQQYSVKQIVTCGVTPQGNDWPRIEELYSHYPELLIPNFGVHPWYIHELSGLNGDTDDNLWLSRLEGLLQTYPQAGVGECGIDKLVLKKHSGLGGMTLERQIDIFEQQITLACQYHRNLIIHGVSGSWGTILQCLEKIIVLPHKSKKTKSKQKTNGAVELSVESQQRTFSPKIILLHSCHSMPLEMIQTFQTTFPDLVYYSVSVQAINSLKMQAVVKAIPRNRLLLESDSPDQLPKVFASSNGQGSALPYNEPSIMLYTYTHIAEILEMNLKELVEQVRANAQSVFP